jgi:hypothetical protein
LLVTRGKVATAFRARLALQANQSHAQDKTMPRSGYDTSGFGHAGTRPAGGNAGGAKGQNQSASSGQTKSVGACLVVDAIAASAMQK